MGPLHDLLNEAVHMTADEATSEIERLARNAAMDLLNAALPPIVRANTAAVKASSWAALGAASGIVGFTLTTADVSNDVISGAVAHKVREGIDELRSNSDYAQGVNSIAW